MVLVVIAVVPLLGAGWSTTQEVVAARQEREQVEQVDRAVMRLVALAELRTRLLDERNWTAAKGGMEQLGLSPEVVQELTNIDVPFELEQAVDRVDALIQAEGLDEAAVRLDGVRSATGEPMEQVGLRYSELEEDIGRRSDALLDEVLTQASGVQDSGALTRSIRTLEASTIARQAVSSQFNHYFSAQFSDLADTNAEVTALVVQNTIRQEALDKLERITDQGSRSRSALDRIAESGDVVLFNEAVADLIASTMDGDGSDAALSGVVANLLAVATIFEASSTTTDLYLELVNAAGEDMDAAGSAATSAARQRNRRAVGSLSVLVVVSILVAIAATRAIARPISRLGAAARQITDGTFAPDVIAESGPVEVRDAARAINEASRHLELAARQAMALADGELEHKSLREPSTGSVGASLQAAVRTLAGSLQEREQLRQQMTFEATHDGLTHLPNRNASLVQLNRGLDRCALNGHQLAVLFIDLDGFKSVNDGHGHHAGDAVLRVTAGRLASAARRDDHVGRLGGDEFLMIAEPVHTVQEARQLAERVQRRILAPIRVGDTEVAIGASIGVAVSAGGVVDADQLLRDADFALYQAKALGRDRIEMCDDGLKVVMAERADLDRAIRSGLEADEFVLYYQPIVEPRTKKIKGYEALIRWKRPGHGVVHPDKFIPFAERSDLIIAIDRWVIGNVAMQIAAWDAGNRKSSVPVSVNLSGRSLSAPDVVANVVGPLEARGIELSRIIIEVTESSVLEDMKTVAQKLQQLRRRGIKIAIDDFGIGYTSLAHLKGLPVDILKIDRSFTSDESALSLVQLIIDTGHLLGATVTAEGVETAEQEKVLTEIGTDDMQGFFLGQPKPVPVSERIPNQRSRSTRLRWAPSSEPLEGLVNRP